jgi:DNA-binding NtrC family response regulator
MGCAVAPQASPRTLVFADPASRALEKLVARVAPSDVPIVISGDAGTGKDALARQIHAISARTGAFVCVNCSAVAARMGEGDPGAADGPVLPVCSEGWFEAARHGTLFLDEIAALPVSLQGQLLRALQDREAGRAEAPDPRPADVRLVAATTVDLSEAISAGHFRLDLFYRLNVAKIRLLPLRQRRGDVAALAAHFLALHAARLNLPLPLLGAETLDALTHYSWPGNIRELENVIRFALLVAPEKELRTEHLKLDDASCEARAVTTRRATEPAHSALQSDVGPPRQALSQWLLPLFLAPGKRLLCDLESQIVAEAFRFTGRNQVQTAALLGISRNVLRTLLKKYGLFVVRSRAERSGAHGKR